jgi:hypothetical protein
MPFDGVSAESVKNHKRGSDLVTSIRARGNEEHERMDGQLSMI